MLDELAARRLQQLKTSRVEYHEGEVLSDKRIYLRLARERYSFDVCAAPFGEGYFFSLRFVQVPRGGWFKIFAALFIAWLLLFGITRVLDRYGLSYWWIVAAIFVVTTGRRRMRSPLVVALRAEALHRGRASMSVPSTLKAE